MACIFYNKPYVFFRCADGAFFVGKKHVFMVCFKKNIGLPEKTKGFQCAAMASETFYVLVRLFLLPNARTCTLAENVNKLHFENNRGIFRNRTAYISIVSKVSRYGDSPAVATVHI